MNIIFNYAVGYLGLRWSILPCNENEKHPSIRWAEYKTKLPTYQNWVNWKTNAQGIALVTGKISGVVVVDIDSTDNKLKLNSPIICRTQSGGYHFYYKWTEETKNKVRINNAPIDFRGDGGIVILPPTTYKNKQYEWIDPPTKHSLSKLTVIPEEIKELLKANGDKKNSANEYKKINLKNFYGISKGRRNNSLFRVALSLCNRCPPKEWDKVVQELYKINKTFQPPLSVKEIWYIFDSASRYVKKNPSRFCKN